MANDTVVLRFSDVTFEYEHGNPVLVAECIPHLYGAGLQYGVPSCPTIYV